MKRQPTPDFRSVFERAWAARKHGGEPQDPLVDFITGMITAYQTTPTPRLKLSHKKFAVACYALTTLPLRDVAALCETPVGVVRKWRTELPFRQQVSVLADSCADAFVRDTLTDLPMRDLVTHVAQGSTPDPRIVPGLYSAVVTFAIFRRIEQLSIPEDPVGEIAQKLALHQRLGSVGPVPGTFWSTPHIMLGEITRFVVKVLATKEPDERARRVAVAGMNRIMQYLRAESHRELGVVTGPLPPRKRTGR